MGDTFTEDVGGLRQKTQGAVLILATGEDQNLICVVENNLKFLSSKL
jgi:hypothetical protein